LLAACTVTTASAARGRADVVARLPKVRSAALLSLDVKEYLVSAGGVAELKEDWSAAAREAIERALVAEFKARNIELRRVEVAPETAEEVDDLRALSQAVTASVGFPGASFDYSVGPVAPLLDRYGVDALVFVWGGGRLTTYGHRFLVGFATGRGEVDATQVAMTIVDRSGEVVWYNTRGLRGADADLRRGGSAAELMRALVEDLPAHKP
jgi:hypothetical protein